MFFVGTWWEDYNFLTQTVLDISYLLCSCSTLWCRSTTSTHGPPPSDWYLPHTWPLSSCSLYCWPSQAVFSSRWDTFGPVCSVSSSLCWYWGDWPSWLSRYFFRGKEGGLADWKSEYDSTTFSEQILQPEPTVNWLELNKEIFLDHLFLSPRAPGDPFNISALIHLLNRELVGKSTRCSKWIYNLSPLRDPSPGYSRSSSAKIIKFSPLMKRK